MGCVQSMEPSEAAEREKDRKLRRKLLEDQNNEMKVQKFLLLGSGESGKSTIFKQARILYLDSFPEETRQTYRHIVYSNIGAIFNELATQLLENHVLEDDVQALARKVTEIEPLDSLRGDVVSGPQETWQKLWSLPMTKIVWDQRDNFYLYDNAPYFLMGQGEDGNPNLDRVLAPEYTPSVQDILQTRVQTTGVVELSFEMGGVPFRLWDVGGQRTERKKWIHCFDNCQAVLFVVGMSEYDQTLREDASQNRMRESLTLFAEICNSRFFNETDMILFLNKKDLFADKLQRVDLSVCFPDYSGGADFDKAAAYLKDQFLAQSRIDRTIFVHYTCATNTNNMRLVLEDARTIVLEHGLKMSGFV